AISLLANLLLLPYAKSYDIDISLLRSTWYQRKTELDTADAALAAAEQTRDDLQEKYDLVFAKGQFMDEFICFVPTGERQFYHTYHCALFSPEETFRAYNIPTAEYLGYFACPICH
ncbi:MAG: hypothetical protein ACK5L3_00165, partial [Oscillospiraceae bacterium]